MIVKKKPKTLTRALDDDRRLAADSGSRQAYQDVAGWLYDEASAAFMNRNQDAAERLRVLWQRCLVALDRVGKS